MLDRTEAHRRAVKLLKKAGFDSDQMIGSTAKSAPLFEVVGDALYENAGGDKQTPPTPEEIAKKKAADAASSAKNARELGKLVRPRR